MRARRALVGVLCLLLVLSPSAGPVVAGPAAGSSPTRTTIVEVQLLGVTATNLTVNGAEAAVLSGSLTSRLGVSQSQVTVTSGQGNGSVEIRADVDPAAVRRALRGSGIDVRAAQVEPNVTAATQRLVRSRVQRRLEPRGVGVFRTVVDGRRGLSIRQEGAPGQVDELLRRGFGYSRVRLRYRTDANRSGLLLRSVLPFAAVESPRQRTAGRVTLRLRPAGAEAYLANLRQVRLSNIGATTCSVAADGRVRGSCILLQVDGELVGYADLAGPARDAARTGTLEDRSVNVTLREGHDPVELRRSLIHGRLRVPVRIAAVDLTSSPPTTVRPHHRRVTGRAVTPPNGTETDEFQTVPLGTTLSPASGPGFGPVAVLAALLVVAALCCRRRG